MVENAFRLAYLIIILLAICVFAISFAIKSRPKSGTSLRSVFTMIGFLALLFATSAYPVYKNIGWLPVAELSLLDVSLIMAIYAGASGGVRKQAGKSILCLPVILSLLIASISLGTMFTLNRELVNALNQLGIGQKSVIHGGPDTSLGCRQSMEKLYIGFTHYTEANDKLPPAEKWEDEEDFRGGVQADEWLHCPSVSNRKDDKYGYAFNPALSGKALNGKKLSEMPDAAKTPLIFDSSDLAKNAHDLPTSLPKPGRHGGKNNILYCDGHIESVAP